MGSSGTASGVSGQENDDIDGSKLKRGGYMIGDVTAGHAV
jgi:hypothetical protein